MNFTSYVFLLLFLPVVLLIYHLATPHSWRRFVLVAASLFFYATTGVGALVLLATEICWVHMITRHARFVGDRARFTAAIAYPLFVLFAYKYLIFFISDVLFLDKSLMPLSLRQLVMPVGISFFTFEMISYSADRFLGKVTAPASLTDLTLFVTFFPHLAAGPILRYSQVREQFKNLDRAWSISLLAIGQGVMIFVFGLCFKVLLADRLAAMTAPMLQNPSVLSPFSSLSLVLALSYRIYFDFHGYSLMAIGLGLLFGLRLPDNFDLPYQAVSPKDFWRRWHISLSYWIRDYLYVPLGGKKRYVVNILIVFGLCGLWHGAGYNYIVWGLFHGLLVVATHALGERWDRIPVFIARGITFCLVSSAWLFFFMPIEEALQVMANGLGAVRASTVLQLPNNTDIVLLAVSSAFAFGFDYRVWTESLLRRPRTSILAGIVLATIFVACLMFNQMAIDFVYFRF